MAALSPEEIEAKYSGTGLGRKSLEEICQEIDIGVELGLEKLSAAGISAVRTDNAREVAQAHDRVPIDLIIIMLRPD